MDTIRKEDFFIPANAVEISCEDEQRELDMLISAAMSFARMTSHCVYIIDYFEKGFLYASDSLAYLCGEHPNRIRELGYNLYLKHVPEDELKMLLEINEKGFKLFDSFPESEKKDYSISYNFHIINGRQKTLINHKITPIALRGGRIWLAMCVISPSARKDVGDIRLKKHGCRSYFEYNRNRGVWETKEEVSLFAIEQEILRLSTNGYRMDEIAKKLYRSVDGIKSCKRSLFRKMGVTNIIEALSYAANYKLL